MFTFGANIKNSIFSRKNITLGLIFVLLVVMLFCGHFQVIGLADSGNMLNIAGIQTVFSVDGMGQGAVFFSIFLLLLATSIFALLILAPPGICKNVDYDTTRRRIFSNISLFFFKLFDPLLQAFRKGIIHSKRYGLSLAVS